MQAQHEAVLQRLLEAVAGGPLKDWSSLTRKLQVKPLPAGAVVFRQGIAHPYVYAVRSGLVKLHYINEQGNEWIKSFSHEGRFFASIAALALQGQTSFMVSTIEPTVLECLPFWDIQALAQSDLGWSRAVANMTMAFAARKEQRERDLLMLNAEQQYRLYCEQEPELVRRLPQKDLERFFGITPVGLNRIVMRVRRSG